MLDLLVRHRADPLGFLVRCAREDGPVVIFELAGRRLLVLSDPGLVQEILVKRQKEFGKAHVSEVGLLPWGRAILGHGLLVSEGESWLRQRRLMQHAFQRARISAYARVAEDATEELLERWADGREHNVHREMSELTLRILARALFGADREVAALYDALRGVFAHREPTRGVLYLVPEWVPTRANRETRRALRGLDEILMGVIAARRAHPAAEEDLLALLLAARDEAGIGLDDRLIRDELVSSIVAGQDTLAATLTWGIDTLADHPGVVARLRSSLALATDVRQEEQLREADGYLQQVMREVLRMFPPGKNVVRVATTDSDLGGLHVAKGTSIVLSQWVIHRDPRWYQQPERFDPDRWHPGFAAGLPRFAFFPFGGGPRLCLGFAVAETVLQVVLARVFARFDLDGRPERRRWDAAQLRPRGGLWLHPRPV